MTETVGCREPSVLDECDITADVREKLLEDIRKRLTPQAVKIRYGSPMKIGWASFNANILGRISK